MKEIRALFFLIFFPYFGEALAGPAPMPSAWPDFFAPSRQCLCAVFEGETGHAWVFFGPGNTYQIESGTGAKMTCPSNFWDSFDPTRPRRKLVRNIPFASAVETLEQETERFAAFNLFQEGIRGRGTERSRAAALTLLESRLAENSDGVVLSALRNILYGSYDAVREDELNRYGLPLVTPKAGELSFLPRVQDLLQAYSHHQESLILLHAAFNAIEPNGFETLAGVAILPKVLYRDELTERGFFYRFATKPRVRQVLIREIKKDAALHRLFRHHEWLIETLGEQFRVLDSGTSAEKRKIYEAYRAH